MNYCIVLLVRLGIICVKFVFKYRTVT